LPLRVRPHDGNSSDCSLGSQAGKSVLPLLDKAAYTDWRTVKLVPVATADDATPFYRVPQLVADTPEGQTVELSVRTEHRGFLTSPGFLHTWPSNEDNAMRVTTNQALIVALGESFSGVALDGYEPSYGNQAADDEHASADECYACHQTLDPMRTFYRGSLSQYYGPQLGEPKDYQAEFRFGGESQDGVGIGDFAHALATHPWFAHAWVQKFCYYANAQACPEGVELDRIAEIFSTESDDRGLFSLRALLAELFSSPLITGSECGPGLGAPPPAVIARKSTFCSQLEHRLGAEANVCGADPMTAIEGTLTQEPGNVLRRNIRDAMAAVPEDTFSRDQADPVIIADTSLFTYGNREAACSHFANNAGNDGADFDAIFMLGSREDALQTMVTQVMGLPTSDERFTEALAVLQAHAQSVFDDENNTSDQERLARQSAFILACMAPSSAGVGF